MPGPLGPSQPGPVTEVNIHHTVTTATTDPVRDARSVAAIGISRFGLMSYSDLAHPDGVGLEGQSGRIGAHTGGRNTISHAVSAICNCDGAVPGDIVPTIADIIVARIAQGIVAPNPRILGHRDHKATACPGGHLYDDLPRIRELVAQGGSPPIDWEAIAEYLEEPDMLIRLKGNPSVLLAGPVATLVAGPIVSDYVKAGVKVVDLPPTDLGRAHYKTVRDRARPFWTRVQPVKVT